MENIDPGMNGINYFKIMDSTIVNDDIILKQQETILQGIIMQCILKINTY